MSSKPVPTIFSKSQENLPKSVLPTIIKPKKLPAQIIQNHDESKIFFENDTVTDFPDIKESLLLERDPNFYYKKMITLLYSRCSRTNCQCQKLHSNQLRPPSEATAIYRL